MTARLTDDQLRELWDDLPFGGMVQSIIEELLEARRIIKLVQRDEDEIQQTLGRVLGYPRYCDDQVNFPGSTDANGVCVGPEVAIDLANMAASRLIEARKLLREVASWCRSFDPAKDVETFEEGNALAERIEELVT